MIPKFYFRSKYSKYIFPIFQYCDYISTYTFFCCPLAAVCMLMMPHKMNADYLNIVIEYHVLFPVSLSASEPCLYTIMCTQCLYVGWLASIQIHSNHMSSARNRLDENAPSPSPARAVVSLLCYFVGYQNRGRLWHTIPETRRHDEDRIIAPGFFFPVFGLLCVRLCARFRTLLRSFHISALRSRRMLMMMKMQSAHTLCTHNTRLRCGYGYGANKSNCLVR